MNIYCDRSNYTNSEAAVAAFQQMGTNGITFLVESLGRGDNVWSRRWSPWIFTHAPMAVAQRLPEPHHADILAYTSQILLDQLTMERRDPTPERTFARLLKLFRLHDDYRREWVASIVWRYTETYPQLDLIPFRAELIRALNDDYLGVRIYIANSSPVAKLVGPELVRSSLTPYLTSSDPALRIPAEEVLAQAGFTNVALDRTNAP